MNTLLTVVNTLVTVVKVLAVIGALVYLIKKSFTYCVDAVYVFREKHDSQPLVRIARVAALIAIVVIAPMKGCEFMQVELYKDSIPLQLELDHLVYHDEESDLRESCGVAVFKLSEKTLSQVNEQSLAFLATATLGRDGDNYHQYDAWRATPEPGISMRESKLLRGGHCIDNPPAIWGEIEKATYEGSAYFTTGSEQDLVIVPRLGVIVFSHNG